MSAGTGIVHSEYNASETERVHSIQIWIDPSAEDLTPSYQQIAFAQRGNGEDFVLLQDPNAIRQASRRSSIRTRELT